MKKRYIWIILQTTDREGVRLGVRVPVDGVVAIIEVPSPGRTSRLGRRPVVRVVATIVARTAIAVASSHERVVTHSAILSRKKDSIICLYPDYRGEPLGLCGTLGESLNTTDSGREFRK